MLKKQLIMLSASLFISVSAFAQKNEVKAAEKALKKNDFAGALSLINKAEGLIANADAKTKAKFYFVKGMALYANGTKPMNVEAAATALRTLMDVEKSKPTKFSAQAGQTINNILIGLNNQAADTYDKANETGDLEGYKKASETYYKVYQLSPRDTGTLYSAAVSAYYAKDYVTSGKHFQGLLDVGFTGKKELFQAENLDGTPRYFNSKKDMDSNVRLKIVKNGKVTVSPSKQKDIYKYLALSNAATGKKEEALAMIAKAREIAPEDYNLILDEANMHYQLGDTAKFSEKLEEAIALKPDNAILHFNVGTLNMDIDQEKSKKHLLKAIELDPNYAEAIYNYGNLILKKLVPVQEELDANAMNFSKYDKIKAEKMMPILREALPHLEKAYELSPSEGSKAQLNSLYENLDMDKRVE